MKHDWTLLQHGESWGCKNCGIVTDSPALLTEKEKICKNRQLTKEDLNESN